MPSDIRCLIFLTHHKIKNTWLRIHIFNYIVVIGVVEIFLADFSLKRVYALQLTTHIIMRCNIP